MSDSRNSKFDLSTGAHRKAKEVQKARSKALRSMVKFDAASFEIFHMDSYEYEKYVAVLFAAKLFQATTQTNDDCRDEEVQTEAQELMSKWTQCPPKWSQMGYSESTKSSRQEILGVGGDSDNDTAAEAESVEKQLEKLRSTARLSEFMSKSGKLLLTVLEHKKRSRLPFQESKKAGSNASEQSLALERGLPVMKNLRMHALTANGEFIACSNSHPLSESSETTKKNTAKNIITVWSLKEPSIPLYFLRVWGHVTHLRMYMLSHVIVSGNKDGSLNFWHLKEPPQYHSHYQDQIIRTPTVNTSCMGEPNHALPVAGLEVISEQKSSLLVISVDKEKYLITWSCIFMQDMDMNQNLSANHSAWAKLRVTVRNVVNLEEAFQTPFMNVYCLHVWKSDIMKFIIGTNAGFVGIGTLNEEIPSYQRCYIGANIIMNVNSVHRNKLLGLVAGTCEDEYCRLFDDRRKRAILSLECGGTGVPFRAQWSEIRECLLYIGQEDRIEAWDLLSSDLSPVKVIPMAKMTDFTTFVTGDREFVVALAGNEISVLLVPLTLKHLDDKERLRFKRYVSII